MKISTLTPSEKKKGRWLLHLEDSTILRVSEREVVSFGLFSGMELTEEMQERLTQAAGESALRERAVALLAARPLSRRTLIQKLVEKEADPGAAEAVADFLEGLGYLNDEVYAADLVRHYCAKGYGERKLREELYRRGVPRTYWEEAIAQAQPPENGIDAFLRTKLKGQEPDAKELKRVSDALARRGYRWEDIKSGLRRYGAEIAEE